MEFNIVIKIENADVMKQKCARLAELFTEAGEILGGINSGTCMECVAVNEIEQDEAFVFVPGKKFEFGGLEWVALDEVDGGIFCIVSKCITDDDADEFPFDENNRNDWRSSTIRNYLNTVFLERIGGADNLIKQTVNLISDDGMNDYGTCEDYVALLSCDQYRKYRSILPAFKSWWWTLTPWTCYASYANHVRIVHPSGTLSYNSAHYAIACAPACIIKSEILKSAPIGGEMEEENES